MLSMEHLADTTIEPAEQKKATLAIMNYESASIELISLDCTTLEEYVDDYDRLVFGKMGYKPESVYYMIADDIAVFDNR